MNFHLTSQVIKENQPIPPKYTCDGENISPPIEWKNSPKETKSFTLIVDDPDAPNKTWVHWIVYNIPPTITEFKEGKIPEGCLEGITDFGKIGYGGPCPPSGVHHYYFKLYALDRMIELPEGATKNQLEKTIKPYIVAETKLMGIYQRHH